MRKSAVWPVVGLFSAALAVAGCQSDSQSEGAGGVSGGAFAGLAIGQGTVTELKEGQVRESELRAYCPRVNLREGTAIYNSFDKKAVDDPTKLIFRGSISDVTRSCSYAPGSIVVSVALAGRVIPGPLAKSGPATVPIRVVAIRGTEILYSQLHQHQVNLDASGGAVQFIFNDPAVTLPAITDGTIQLFAGFDEGPQKKKE